MADNGGVLIGRIKRRKHQVHICPREDSGSAGLVGGVASRGCQRGGHPREQDARSVRVHVSVHIHLVLVPSPLTLTLTLTLALTLFTWQCGGGGGRKLVHVLEKVLKGHCSCSRELLIDQECFFLQTTDRHDQITAQDNHCTTHNCSEKNKPEAKTPAGQHTGYQDDSWTLYTGSIMLNPSVCRSLHFSNRQAER